MTTQFASVQYDDLKGTVALDGHNHEFLQDLSNFADVPNGYWPVGFELGKISPNKNGKLPFVLLAVRNNSEFSKVSEIVSKAMSEEVTAYQFDGEIAPADFDSLAKRLDIKIIERNLFETGNLQISESGP